MLRVLLTILLMSPFVNSIKTCIAFIFSDYQGLTKSFCHGKIYCSLITARLVNMKIGIPWDRIQVLSLNQRITIDGIYVTCLDANHCPGSIIILFEPPNGKVWSTLTFKILIVILIITFLSLLRSILM